MQIKITSKQSIYIEVAEKIESFIKLGVFKENEKLPSCRKLGLELGVNPNTIERAYSLLEEKNIVYTIPKKGIFVCPANQDHIFLEEVINTLEHFKEMGITKGELEELILKIYEEEKQ
ncbi:MAG: GntR family transcriptional regulator [Anaeroplasmataceae bacterium]|nr:GntR family transcriptional regulator [Anaeroplasmataceae bacterium]MDE6414814.1 GntR family transcriptional regulator [Anaeroplasmataceae bacterium]